MRLYIIIVSLVLLCYSGRMAAQPISERVVNALEKSNHGALAATFHTMIDLQLPGYNGNFSQSQASVILKKFLSDHPVSSVSISRNGVNSDGSKYSIGELVSAGKRYRLYFVTRENAGQERVMVFKITDI